MKSLGQRASPWGRPLRNLIGSDVSRPCFVVATAIVFQLLLNFSTVLIVIIIIIIIIVIIIVIIIIIIYYTSRQ